MSIVRGLLDSPEVVENPLPPRLPGMEVTESKLNALRRPQLVSLATAFGIEIPRDASKADILPYMIQAEKAGRFRGKPVSQYHLLLAQMDADRKWSERERADFDAALMRAAENEFGDTDEPSRPRGPYKPAFPDDGRTLEQLQAEAKELGINIMAKTSAALRRLIAEAKAGPEKAA